MNYLRNLTMLITTVLLTGCYNMEYTFHFQTDDKVDEALDIIVPRQIWDSPFFDSAEICSDSEIFATNNFVTCTDQDTYDLQYVLDASRSKNPVLEQEFFPLHLEQPAPDEIVVNIDIRSMIETVDTTLGLGMMIGLAETTPAFKNAYNNAQVTFSFTGQNVISTTGTTKNGGRTASVTFPMRAFADPSLAPAKFKAHLKTKDCWLFGMICS